MINIHNPIILGAVFSKECQYNNKRDTVDGRRERGANPGVDACSSGMKNVGALTEAGKLARVNQATGVSAQPAWKKPCKVREGNCIRPNKRWRTIITQSGPTM